MIWLSGRVSPEKCRRETLGDRSIHDFMRATELKVCGAMHLGFVRPSVAEGSVRVYERALHPELFDAYVTGRVATKKFRTVVMICEAGHLAQFTYGDHTVAEVTGPGKRSLPPTGLREQHALPQGKELSLELDGPVHYHFTGHVDRVDEEVFARINTELEADARSAFLCYQFPRGNRLNAGPMSIVNVEGSATSLIIHSFHTFPEELSILRTQSLFEFTG